MSENRSVLVSCVSHISIGKIVRQDSASKSFSVTLMMQITTTWGLCSAEIVFVLLFADFFLLLLLFKVKQMILNDINL